jgi:hypothetical protein
MVRASYRGGPGEPSWADATVPVSPVITLEGVSKHFQNTAADIEQVLNEQKLFILP